MSVCKGETPARPLMTENMSVSQRWHLCCPLMHKESVGGRNGPRVMHTIIPMNPALTDAVRTSLKHWLSRFRTTTIISMPTSCFDAN